MLGSVIISEGPAQFQRRIDKELAEWDAVIKKAGVVAELTRRGGPVARRLFHTMHERAIRVSILQFLTKVHFDYGSRRELPGELARNGVRRPCS